MNTFRPAMILVLWLGTLAACAATEEVLFTETFEEDLDAGWTWLRETPEDWRLVDGALELRARPGKADTVRNALVRSVPDAGQRGLAFEVTVTFTTPLTEQYEQAGLTWYADGEPVFKLVHELIDDAYFIIPGRVPTEKKAVRLRLIVEENCYVAQFREEGEEDYRVAGEGTLTLGEKNQISIQCYHGPERGDHWMRFSDFKILALE